MILCKVPKIKLEIRSPTRDELFYTKPAVSKRKVGITGGESGANSK